MYTKHPSFDEPNNKEQKVWRYLDFTKFVSLIETQELFFTRADKFEDKFEGSIPSVAAAIRDYQIKEMVEQGKLLPQYGKPGFMSSISNHSRKTMAINCWHMNDFESAAMWKLYLKSDEGIAIQSTFNCLVDSISDNPIDIQLGKVKYIDYNTEVINLNNGFNQFIHKRKSFEHENELRAVIWTECATNKKIISDVDYGIKVKVDIKKLMQRIYICPSSPSWFSELVFSICEKYGIEKSLVVKSDLEKNPVF